MIKLSKAQWLSRYYRCMATMEELRSVAKDSWTGYNCPLKESWDDIRPNTDDDHLETCMSNRATCILLASDHSIEER